MSGTVGILLVYYTTLCVACFSMSEKLPTGRLGQYTDPTGELPNQTLRMGEWYVSHRKRLRRIGITLLIVWCVFTISAGIYGWGKYAVVGYYADQQMAEVLTRTTINYEALHATTGAQSLRISSPQLFQGTPGKYDFMVRVKNPNQRWLAWIEYKFVYVGGETQTRLAFVLPGAERLVAELGTTANSYPVDAQLVLTNSVWKNINPHAVSDVENFISSRLQFPVTEVQFTPASLALGLASNQVTFSLTNASPYSYWSPEFYVELLQGSETVGVLPLQFDRFRSGEKRTVDLRSLISGLSVTDVQVYPIVNVFDKNVYIAPGT